MKLQAPDPYSLTRDLLLARSREISPRLLARIARYNHHEVLLAVAANVRTPSHTLFRLGVRFPEVLRSHPTFLRGLADDRLWRQVPNAALRSLLRLPVLPRAALERMATRRARDVRDAATARLAQMGANPRDEDGRRRLPLSVVATRDEHEDESTEALLEGFEQRYSIRKEGVRCIDASALLKLRHPSRSKQLRDFIEGSGARATLRARANRPGTLDRVRGPRVNDPAAVVTQRKAPRVLTGVEFETPLVYWLMGRRR